MTYEAVPIDVEIQKLTAAERDGLSRHKIHENINTLLGNENTPILIGAAALVAFLPLLLELLLQAQEDALNITLTDNQKQTLKDTALVSLTGPTGLGFLLGRKVGKGLVGTIMDFELPKDFKFGGKGLA
jgi:hypothetical protein